jgi:predicted MFS family arabinose efflux permease
MNESPAVPADQPSTTARSRQWLILLYILVAFLYFASLFLYLPTLPTYVESKSESLALVGVVLAQYGLWQALIRLPLGIAADWLGRRKPFIIGGLILAGLGAWVMGTAESAGGLAAGRAITGLAAGTWVPLTVAFSGLFPAQEAIRATSLLTFVGSVGRVSATSMTGLLNELGGYSLAFFAAAGAAALGMLVMFSARERVHHPRRPSVAGIGHLITRRDVLLPSLLAAVSQYANWAVTYGFLPILAESLGATDVTLSMLVSMHIGVVTVMTLVAAGLVNRVGARRLVLVSFVLTSGGIGLVAVAHSLTLIFVAQFFLGVAQGLGYPVLMGMSIRDVADAERNTAMGLHQSVYAIGMFAGPWLSGMLADAIGIRQMFVVTALACLVIGLVMIRLLPRKQ